MTERFEWGGDDFPVGDREIWEELYPQSPPVADMAPEPVRPVEIPDMSVEVARERIRNLHSSTEQRSEA